MTVNRDSGRRAEHPRVPAPRRPRDPDAIRALTSFAADYRAEATRLERERDELRRRRDEAIVAACEAGIPQRDIAAALAISQQLVSRVLRSRR